MDRVTIKKGCWIAVTLFFWIHSAIAADGFTISAGTDFSTGKYGGTASTDIWYVPFVGRYDRGPASFRLTVPYLNITGPGNILGPGIGGIDGAGGIGGGGGGGGGVFACGEDRRRGADKPEDDGTCTDTGAGGTPATNAVTRRTESGLGDLVAGFTYNLLDHKPSGLVFDITGRIKIPTASAARGLGSGKLDYAVQGDLIKSISQFSVFTSFGYRILGDPSGVIFHNVFYGAAGLGYKLSSTSLLGTSFNIGQSPLRLQDSRDLSVYFTHRVGENFRFNVYGLKGFSERSPDWGSGVTLRYVF
ncbi:hypothetical protein EBAPG3_014020 [Nitrosospira lacus]|uniref:Uncharacterized protein n=1 Tax=Nitrosospira lacus TaxID=1288494 RepID=A0A1W6SSL0_9PROT|nr:hypothetical protein EBAPG3_014020 [Nitrosospira lacus]